MSLQVDFVGHSTLLIELDGIRLLTDPATRGRIGPLRRAVRVPDRHHLAGIDLALISHLHWDHLDVPSLQNLGRNARVLVPKGAGRWLETAGFRHVTEIALRDRLELGGLQIEAVPAAHSGFRPPAGPTAQALGYVIRGTRSIYFAGDTDLFPEMTELAGSIDLALLPVWGWGPVLGRAGHLDPVKAAQSLRLIRPRAAVPIHWGHVLAARHGAGLPGPSPGAAGGLCRACGRTGSRRSDAADRARRGGGPIAVVTAERGP